ncbi:MAG: hypothetical protein MUP26_00025 [Desulfobulbaceae bacterium]|nr:hypothetical protein [Desulfobulbaceae bacterium]
MKRKVFHNLYKVVKITENDRNGKRRKKLKPFQKDYFQKKSAPIPPGKGIDLYWLMTSDFVPPPTAHRFFFKGYLHFDLQSIRLSKFGIYLRKVSYL